MKLNLQRKYKAGWMTVGVIDTIGEMEWLGELPDNYRLLDQELFHKILTERGDPDDAIMVSAECDNCHEPLQVARSAKRICFRCSTLTN